MEVIRINKLITKANAFETRELKRLHKELDEWISISNEMEKRYPNLFSKLFTEIEKDTDPEDQVAKMIMKYEEGEQETKKLIREVCELCLVGFRETLENLEINIDSWDWESDFIWNGNVNSVIEQLKMTPYVFQENNVLEFDAEKVANELDLKQKLNINRENEIPSLTLIRTDGTSLYTTRDIAYHLWKFEKSDEVINVIGIEQTLPQIQLKLALTALGHVDYLSRITHFAYNLVRLPGYRMSSRRGHYITLDDVLLGASDRAYKEVTNRSPNLSEEEKKRIATFVGKGAVKYALVSVDPTKPVVFTWDRVLDFEKNSAPYLQYSHARACSILRKVSKNPKKADYSLLITSIERELILNFARFPEVFIDASDNLRPNAIADYLNTLGDKFNRFYTKLPVIKAESIPLSEARLALVDVARIVFRNGLNLLGITAPERM
jgi:arginyl-tRNA synthetase